MDLGDMSVPRTDFKIPVDEGMPILEIDDDEPLPFVNVDAIVQALEVTPVRMMAPKGLWVVQLDLRRVPPKMYSPREP